MLLSFHLIVSQHLNVVFQGFDVHYEDPEVDHTILNIYMEPLRIRLNERTVTRLHEFVPPIRMTRIRCAIISQDLGRPEALVSIGSGRSTATAAVATSGGRSCEEPSPTAGAAARAPAPREARWRREVGPAYLANPPNHPSISRPVAVPCLSRGLSPSAPHAWLGGRPPGAMSNAS